MAIYLTQIQTGLNRIEGFIGEKSIHIAARVVKDRILTLTSQGLDYEGVPFPKVSSYGRSLAAYSYQYGITRSRYGLQIEKRDLRFFGTMLDSIFFLAYQGGGLLTMPDDQLQIAEYNIMRGDDFFNASEETVELAYQEIERELDAELEGWISNE